ncbi:DUF1653 domain-containing protein [Streptomyces erythrochromogenes]|uniref:DUF1653 domain-containing protein n=1 Tax=Streptomyces erythrochromogenes TaxID=285574 RepID=UPI0034303655
MVEIHPGVYQHYKGGLYRVLHTARHTETSEVLVVYQGLRSKDVWVRPLAMFGETVPTASGPQLRFRLVGEEAADTE